MGQPLRLGQVRLVTLQLLGQQFLLGDIDRGAQKPLEDFAFNNRNSDAANVTLHAVRANNSLCHVAARMFRTHSLYGVSHKTAVLWVNGCQILLKCGGSLVRIQAINLEQLLRPVVKKSRGVKCPTAHMGEALPFAQIKLVLLKRLLGALALRYIDYGTYELIEIAGSVEDRMTDGVNVPDPFFRMNDPVVHFEIRFVADGFLGPFHGCRLIVRMNSMKEFFESRQRASGIETQYAVAHRRPVPDIAGRGVPCPTASLTESLRFRQICFAFT